MLGDSGLLRSNAFKGAVISDWGATHDSAKENANAGLDIEMPGDWILIGGGVYGGGLKSAVNSGDVSVEVRIETSMNPNLVDNRAMHSD